MKTKMFLTLWLNLMAYVFGFFAVVGTVTWFCEKYSTEHPWFVMSTLIVVGTGIIAGIVAKQK